MMVMLALAKTSLTPQREDLEAVQIHSEMPTQKKLFEQSPRGDFRGSEEKNKSEGARAGLLRDAGEASV